MTELKNIKYGSNDIPLRKFPIDDMCDSPSIVMIAKRGSGKSYVTREILYRLRKRIPGGIIISKTENVSPFYSEFIPDIYIHYEYSDDVMKSVFDRQTELKRKLIDKKKKGKTFNPRAFLVMDDCLSSKGTWVKDKYIQEIFFNGRHFSLTYLLTMQFSLGVTPELRSNFDYVFLLKTDINTEIKKYFDHYAGIFPNLETFRDVFSQVTKDHGCLVINNRATGDSFLDKVFWYKASNTPPDIGTYGCSQYKYIHKKNYDKNWRDRQYQENKSFDIGAFEKKKNRKTAIVSKITEEEEN